MSKRLARLSPEQREALLRKLKQSGKSNQRSRIVRRKGLKVFPVSFQQQRLWYLNQFDPKSSFYNMPSVVRMQGEFDQSALRETLEYITQRHEILRAVFPTQNGAPRQKLLEHIDFDLTPVQAAGRTNTEILNLIHKETQAPFDLTRGPLIRSKLLNLSDKEHILVITMHHIIADGWSIAIFVEEFAVIYSALHSKKSPTLLPLDVQYADYAAWQNEWLATDEKQKQLDFWKDRLAGVPHFLELPYNRPRSAVQTFNGAHISFHLHVDLVQKIHKLNKRNGVTLFMSLMAAFQAILHLYTDQDDISVGTTMANRERPELKNLMGFFINTLVMHGDLSENPTFEDFLKQIKTTTLDAFANQELPFEQVVDALKPKRNTSYSPLFQVLFVLQNAPKGKLELPDLTLSLVDTQLGSIKFDLSIILEEVGKDIQGLMGYNTDLFEKSTIEKLVAHYIRLLEVIVENPKLHIKEIPLLSTDEENQILSTWNNTERLLEDKFFVQEVFESQAAKSPDAIALIVGTEQLTYCQLNETANRLAAFLLTQGAGPETMVAIGLERSIDTIIAVLAVLKAGAAFLPLDISNPQERLRYILEDTQAPLLLRHKSSASIFSDYAGKTICIDKLEDVLSGQSVKNLGIQPQPSNLAYVIYTSGSTGLPKGVLITHKGLVNLSRSLGDKYRVSSESRCLQFASFGFDAAVEEILTPLIHGATLVVMQSNSKFSATDLITTIQDQKLSHITLSPSLLSMLDPAAFPDLINVTSMGEACPAELASLWSKHVQFFNGYGPTENTVGSLVNFVDRPVELLRLPIGRPIDNVKVYILNQNMQPLPIGIPGEIYLTGPGLARGYLKRTDLTAEKFVPNPFSTEEGERLYRSGDLGRYLADGQIDFIGRLDDQVQIRGNRVEIGEIQANLERHGHIRRCAVLLKKDHAGNDQLTAYVVTKDGKVISIDELKKFLGSKLPEYMIPVYFIFLDEIPLNRSGKINKNALPDPDSGLLQSENVYIAPSTKLEKFIYQLWFDILKIERIGIHDNFFSIGGNSIQSAVFVNRLQDALGEYVYIVAIYDAPTIAKMSDYITKEYPQAAERISGKKISNTVSTVQKIGRTHIQDFKRIIRVPDYSASENISDRPKNPSAVFILSAPRSGSTLTRAMLGGHPKLFSPPELQLLNYDTLQDRKALLSGRDDFWLDGTVRAIMELKSCTEVEAREIMLFHENRNDTIPIFYNTLQSWLNGNLFIDKTPNYALSEKILEQTELHFQNSKFIHLIRHPYGVIPSFEKARLHVFYPPFFTEEHSFSSRELAELVWTVSHQNILSFLEKIPAERQIQIRFEDLVSDPNESMDSVCALLGIDFHPDMLNPQKDRDRRMTDALNEHSKMLGDVRFHEHTGVTADRAYQWKQNLDHDYLGDETWKLIESFGYEKQNSLKLILNRNLSEIERLPENADHPLSFAQERLWFLDQLEPGLPQYNMPVTVSVKGKLNKSVFIQSIYRLTERQQILRSIYKTENGTAQQIILPQAEIAVKEIHLTGKSQAKKLLLEEARTPFDLSKGPLLRILIIRNSETDHIIMFNIHHIVADGLSVGIMIKELLSIYASLEKGEPLSLPDLSIQYADYAHWQRTALSGQNLEKELSFWKKQIQDAPSLLELPTDFPRPAVQSFKGKRIRFELSKEISQDIKKLARNWESTEFMVLVSVFNLLLHRYSHQSKILIGTPVANRRRREVEGLIGFFINTLILRADFSRPLSFKEFFEEMKKSTIAAYSHQDLPFEKIVDSLKIERSLSYNPIFQVMFTFQPPILQEEIQNGLTFSPVEIDTGIAKFDINLSMAEHHGKLGGEWEFNTDLFTSDTIKRMITHFTNLLTEIVQNPELPVSQYNLFDKDERLQILQNFNSVPLLEYQHEGCLHQQFEKQVELTPAALAMADSETRLTYQQLNVQANRLAHILLEREIAAETVVAFMAERSVESIVTLMGILKAGAAYLPVDPAYPAERINYMLDDSGAALLICSGDSTKPQGVDSSQMLVLDQVRDKLATQPETNPQIPLSAENMAYIIYTSGSTGKPKGVVVQHRSTLNLAENLNQVVYKKYAGKPRRISLNAPLAFDASVQQLVMLTRGHSIHIVPQELRYDGEGMLKFIRTHKIELLDCVPSQLKLMLQSGLTDEGSWSPKDILPGGEAIDSAMWAELTAFKQINFYNMYGPSECTVDSTICPVDEFPEKPTIGRPASNARFYVLNNNMQPVPVGVTGELYIAGEGLARGYQNRPELSAEKFLPDPFSGVSGSRFYRSGDLASFNLNGTLNFIGRTDHQVKLRGFRIELGEIENALLKSGQIKNAVVIVREDTPGHQRLLAYIVTKNGFSNKPGSLRQFLSAFLPEYMIPTHIIELDNIPLNSNGKVDRSKLPLPETFTQAVSDDYVSPANEKETTLAAIWQEVLQIDQISVRDNFFEMGGDSILSIQVVARATQAGLKVTPRQIFEYPTVQALAAVAGTGTAIQADQGIVSGPFPLTAIQQDFFNRNLSAAHHWNQSLLVALTEPLNTKLLEQVFRNLTVHHDIFRAQFGKANGILKGFIKPEFNEDHLQTQELNSTVFVELENELEMAANRIQASFDLEKGPLFRAVYFKTTASFPDYLLIVAHHLIIDAVSWRIFTEDIQTLYKQLSTDQAIQLPPKSTSFIYWSERVRSYAESELPDEEVAYWNSFAKMKFTDLPIDKSGTNLEADTASVEIILEARETEALLKEVPVAYQTQINEILLTALACAGRKWFQSNTILINMEGHGREDIFEEIDLSRTLGWFTTLYPLKLQLNGNNSLGESIKSVKEQYRQIPNNGFGYGLLKYFRPEALSEVPEPDIGFNYLGQFQQKALNETPLGVLSNAGGFERGPQNERQHKLEISASIIDGVLTIIFAFSKNLHTEETIRTWAGQYLHELKQLIQHCQDPDSGAYTPSDFRDVQLDEEEIGDLLEELEE